MLNRDLGFRLYALALKRMECEKSWRKLTRGKIVMCEKKDFIILKKHRRIILTKNVINNIRECFSFADYFTDYINIKK